MKITRAIAFIGIGVAAGQADAAVITQIQDFAFVPNGSQTNTFNKFDSSLGVLNRVTVTVVLNKTGGRFEVDNDSSEAGTVTLSHTVQGVFSTSLGSQALLDTNFSSIGSAGTLNATNSSAPQAISGTSGDDTNSFNVTGLQDYYQFLPGNATMTDGGDIASVFMGLYQSSGPATFTTTITANQLVEVVGLGGLQQAFTVSNVSGSITVVYDYSAIPEPSGLLLGGMGLLALLQRRRR